MSYYTVVLHRPEYLEISDPYVAFTDKPGVAKAIRAAKVEARRMDKKEGCLTHAAEDYKVCVVFNGVNHPVFYGWQE
jgi:hypothetical protein